MTKRHSFKSGFVEEAEIGPRSYDVVTCLEVLEHAPEWLDVLDLLLSIARRRVVVTVPYAETIQYTVCIHCGKMAPMYGHLRRYDERTFRRICGWQLSFSYIMDRAIVASWARRTYRMIHPRRGWLVACYDAINAS